MLYGNTPCSRGWQLWLDMAGVTWRVRETVRLRDWAVCAYGQGWYNVRLVQVAHNLQERAAITVNRAISDNITMRIRNFWFCCVLILTVDLSILLASVCAAANVLSKGTRFSISQFF